MIAFLLESLTAMSALFLLFQLLRLDGRRKARIRIFEVCMRANAVLCVWSGARQAPAASHPSRAANLGSSMALCNGSWGPYLLQPVLKFEIQERQQKQQQSPQQQGSSCCTSYWYSHLWQHPSSSKSWEHAPHLSPRPHKPTTAGTSQHANRANKRTSVKPASHKPTSQQVNMPIRQHVSSQPANQPTSQHANMHVNMRGDRLRGG
jgi:hypothetical protein